MMRNRSGPTSASSTSTSPPLPDAASVRSAPVTGKLTGRPPTKAVVPLGAMVCATIRRWSLKWPS